LGPNRSLSECSEVTVDKQRPGILQFAGIGLLNAVCLGAGLTAGWFVDRALGTLPLFLFVGLFAGIVCGVMATRSEIKKYS
jgi:F0F1-type ATP synthase assembly protein I